MRTSPFNAILLRRLFNTSAVCRNDEKSTIVKNLLERSATYSDAKPASHDDEWATLPYPVGTVMKRNQGSKSFRPKIDPKDTSIILFPGQGAQYVGMAQNLIKIPEARDIFELASEVLKYDLLKMCLEGPKSKLDKTIYCQPAVMVTSLATLEKLKEERPMAIESCVGSAGFSLGEITALVFAGSIPFDKAVKLVQIRAEAMQAASDQFRGGMATVLYGPDSELGKACTKAKEWCLDRGVENPECRIANYLYPHCKVVAGSIEALQFIEKNSKQFKLRRVKPLPVSGAFHTDLMQSAVEPFKMALKKIIIEDPMVPVYSNVDGKRYQNADHIRRQLPKQIVKPVKWEQSLHILYERQKEENFPRTFECGPGKGLTTILKQVNAKAWDNAHNVEP